MSLWNISPSDFARAVLHHDRCLKINDHFGSSRVFLAVKLAIFSKSASPLLYFLPLTIARPGAQPAYKRISVEFAIIVTSFSFAIPS